MKYLFLILIFSLGTIQTLASKLPNPIPPSDPATIEALISLHKATAKAERESLSKLQTSLATSLLFNKKTLEFKDVREILDTKTGSLYSYVLLAARIAFISKGLVNLTKTYADFTSSTTQSLFKKPMTGWYYTEAIRACGREIKAIEPILLRFGATSLDLMSASMDEKLFLLSTIAGTIEKCQRIMDEAYFYCSYVVQGGFNRMFLDDIFETSVTDDIAKGIITLYYEV